ncbi:adenosylcobinamide-GDP ribazoletransferase [Methylocystis bryophila]|uniref:Adenosylcobinamide-GDP ribazoletransferase n=1 Tax=Methylocystis bryophila TaxID=655015 RepID=A0A1W6MX56_9HYPH|nr:adenosylcobinamide-GDP ribazoletransferase [Methylocystis bryophila]ARN82099.1 adenosylcobinamide-GDP ribazoletransferase [Methylocystis bryophila]BDV38225.1 adenosylcobinamide-GDP ribazoletransferase [Methylocystis bryophila]
MKSLPAWPRDWGLCLRFYSRLDWGGPRHVEMSRFAEALRTLPLAGGAIGVIGALALALSRALGLSPLVAATIGVAALVAVTGGLHEDGLADVADGFGGGVTRTRKLEIMRDSRLGAYGGIALGLSLLLRVSPLSALAERSTLLAVAAMIATGALSRMAGLAPLLALSPARPEGAGAAMPRPSSRALAQGAALAALLSLAPALFGASLGQVLAADLAACLAAVLVARLAGRQIGGYTGDVLGAAQQAAEIAALLALSAG